MDFQLLDFSQYDDIIICKYYPLKISDIKMFTISFFFWVSWFNIIRLSPLPFKPAHARVSKDDEFDLKNRFTAFCHGLSLMLGAIYTYYIVPGNCGSPNK